MDCYHHWFDAEQMQRYLQQRLRRFWACLESLKILTPCSNLACAVLSLDPQVSWLIALANKSSSGCIPCFFKINIFKACHVHCSQDALAALGLHNYAHV